MRVCLAALLGITIVNAGTLPTAREYAAELKSSTLDPQECYRVRDVTLVREDVRLYFTDGYLIFGKPVDGRRISAVFAADTEAGDGELLLMPPHRSERRSLATFAKTPNLDEHLALGVFVFTDGTAEELAASLQSTVAKKAPEIGTLLADKWNPVVRNITSSFEIRLVTDHFSEHKSAGGFFFAALSGKQVGNFDVIVDPAAREQISVGQVSTRENRTYFNTWTSFPGRSWRTGKRELAPKEIDLSDFRIEATLGANLHLKVVTRMNAKILAPVGRALGFDLSRRMAVSKVLVNNEPAELFTRTDSLRANLLRGPDNELFLAVTPQPPSRGRLTQSSSPRR